MSKRVYCYASTVIDGGVVFIDASDTNSATRRVYAHDGSVYRSVRRPDSPGFWFSDSVHWREHINNDDIRWLAGVEK